jgi:putative copper export protein
MSMAWIVATVTRWGGFVALAALIGSLAVDCLVVPAETPDLHDDRRRLRRIRVASIIVLSITSVAEVVLRGQTMAGGDLRAVVRAIPVILERTHFGQIWLVRFFLLAAALIATCWMVRTARVIALGAALAVAFTTSATGHAGDWGDLSLSAGLDWVHVIASATWIGGLLSLTLLGARRVISWPPALLRTVTGRFSRLAGWSLLAVVLSGAYNGWVQVARVDALWTTSYGRVLCVKVLLVGVLAWLGALCRYTVVAPLVDRGRRGLGRRLFRLGRLALIGAARAPRALLPSRFFRYVFWEAGLGIVVLVCTAVLVDSTPARHAAHAGHRVEGSSGPIRLTMDELHEQGGVPRGWIFRPPAGDVRRGREVFRQMACFACHNVSGEGFPPGSGQGPDLTDVGAHHPIGYLLESILNPNAVIIDAPGYTDPQGRSMMPDYRKNLSVNQLIDLVAYLGNLNGR